MAKRRKDDDYTDDYQEPAATQPEPSDSTFEDSQPTEAEAVEEGVAPTTGGPQKYRVERAGGTVRGQALEEGQFVVLTPEEAQRQAQSGVQLSWTPEDQVPDEIDNTLPEPEAEATSKSRR